MVGVGLLRDRLTVDPTQSCQVPDKFHNDEADCIKDKEMVGSFEMRG